MAKLIIRHISKKRGVNAISIILDGDIICDIRAGDILEFPLVAGNKMISAKIGQRKSEILSFCIQDREYIQFSVWADGNLLKSPVIKKDIQATFKNRFSPYDATLKSRYENETGGLSSKIEWEAILGISRPSSEAEIRKAFITLMKEHHPDKTIFLSEDQRKESESRAAEVTMAYNYFKKYGR